MKNNYADLMHIYKEQLHLKYVAHTKMYVSFEE